MHQVGFIYKIVAKVLSTRHENHCIIFGKKYSNILLLLGISIVIYIGTTQGSWTLKLHTQKKE